MDVPWQCHASVVRYMNWKASHDEPLSNVVYSSIEELQDAHLKEVFHSMSLQSVLDLVVPASLVEGVLPLRSNSISVLLNNCVTSLDFAVDKTRPVIEQMKELLSLMKTLFGAPKLMTKEELASSVAPHEIHVKLHALVVAELVSPIIGSFSANTLYRDAFAVDDGAHPAGYATDLQLTGHMAYASAAKFDDRLGSPQSSAYGSSMPSDSSDSSGDAASEQPGASNDKDQHVGYQFNERYQRVIDKDPGLLSYANLKSAAAVLRSFVEVAVTYGRIIIAEKGVPASQKSFPPCNVGGVAGGEKFIVCGVLFKFSLDPLLPNGKYLYGDASPDQEAARKAAGRELLGMTSVYSCGSALRIPPMVIIDWLGFRLIAMALLPINKSTLAYGSADGGRTVRFQEAFHHEFESLGDHLNLREHEVGADQNLIIGPGDIEGHHGTDNRRYIIDLGRLFPPEYPKHYSDRKAVPREVFFRLLRPELVVQSPVPLCSDTFTMWNQRATEKDDHERDVVAATKIMHELVIPSVAERLEKAWRNGTSDVDVTKMMHSHGINMRWLGVVILQ